MKCQSRVWIHNYFFKEAVILSPVRSNPSQGFSGSHSGLCFCSLYLRYHLRLVLFYEIFFELFFFSVKVSFWVFKGLWFSIPIVSASVWLLVFFSFLKNCRGTHGMYKACMRVPVPYLHTARVHTLADEVSVACLCSEFFFREAVILSPVRSDPPQGFSGSHSGFCVCIFVS